MSYHATVAAVTSALGELLDTAISAAVPAASVAYARPNTDVAGQPRLHVYLYQAVPNPAARNLDLPTRDSDGVVRCRPFEALDLCYLFTFIGNDGRLEPQLMLGSAVAALNARPTLAPERIRDARPDPLEPPFIGDDPDVPIVPVRLSPMGLNLEELSKVWSVLFQTPYALSIAYRASVVLVESDLPIKPALPAQQPSFTGEPLHYPEIIEVVSPEGRFFPVTVDSGVAIIGRRLPGEITLVRFGADDVTPTTLGERRLESPLPVAGMRAGVHAVRVVNRVFDPDPGAPVEEVVSNPMSFVLHPIVRTVALVGSDAVVEVEPAVDESQRAQLLLDQIDAVPPVVQVVEHPPFTGSLSTLTFDLTGVPPGTYAVRVRVDGATSRIDIDQQAGTLAQTVTVAP